MSKRWSLEMEMKKAEAKMLCQKLTKKFSCSKDQFSHDAGLPPSVVTTQTPPRGKRAFLCGVTYKKQKYELKGSAQDVKNMRDLLVELFSFPVESILVLAEEESYIPPTRKNIEDAFRWLVRGIQSRDSLVFYFSGHGFRQRAWFGDEIDGFDEAICPVDFQTNGMILDNYINQAIVAPLPVGVTLHAIVDSCHSGTILDLPYVYDINRGKWNDNRPPSGAYKGTIGGKAICFSACEDYQLAADTSAFSPEKEMTGAMTCTFIKAIKQAAINNEKITYHLLMDCMHKTINEVRRSGCFSVGFRRVFNRRILQACEHQAYLIKFWHVLKKCSGSIVIIIGRVQHQHRVQAVGVQSETFKQRSALKLYDKTILTGFAPLENLLSLPASSHIFSLLQ